VKYQSVLNTRYTTDDSANNLVGAFLINNGQINSALATLLVEVVVFPVVKLTITDITGDDNTGYRLIVCMSIAAANVG
jgi:hypothetical protein